MFGVTKWCFVEPGIRSVVEAKGCRYVPKFCLLNPRSYIKYKEEEVEINQAKVLNMFDTDKDDWGSKILNYIQTLTDKVKNQ